MPTRFGESGSETSHSATTGSSWLITASRCPVGANAIAATRVATAGNGSPIGVGLETVFHSATFPLRNPTAAIDPSRSMATAPEVRSPVGAASAARSTGAVGF